MVPYEAGGGEADGTEFAGVMAQRVFSTIGTAAEDVAAVFGNEAPDLSAAFMVWALQETERQGVSGCTISSTHAIKLRTRQLLPGHWPHVPEHGSVLRDPPGAGA